MLEIKLESNGMLFRVGCWLCEHSFRLDVLVAIPYIDGEKKGFLCERCLEQGPEGIRKALLDRAAHLREWTETVVEDMLREAAYYEQQAGAANIPDSIVADYQAISAAIEKEAEREGSGFSTGEWFEIVERIIENNNRR